jgi:hypothetical protein
LAGGSRRWTERTRIEGEGAWIDSDGGLFGDQIGKVVERDIKWIAREGGLCGEPILKSLRRSHVDWK